MCHLDIKPENLLLDEMRNVKLCDFGSAAYFRSGDTGEKRVLRQSCGSVPYAAPEVGFFFFLGFILGVC